MLYPKDKSVVISGDDQRLRMTCKWDSGNPLAFYFISGIFFMFAIAPATIRDETGRTSPSLAVVFAFIGVVALVFAIFGSMGKTLIDATAESIVLTYGPVGITRRFATRGVKQFFLGQGSSSSSSLSRVLYLFGADDHVHRISGMFANSFAANQVRHELQRFYKLKDQAVYGQDAHHDHIHHRSPG